MLFRSRYEADEEYGFGAVACGIKIRRMRQSQLHVR